MIENKSYKIGFVWIFYQYRNELEEIIARNNIHDIEVVGI